MDRKNWSKIAAELAEPVEGEEEGASFRDLLRALVYALLAVAGRLRRIEDVACSIDDLRDGLVE